jgi:hypothetical protein
MCDWTGNRPDRLVREPEYLDQGQEGNPMALSKSLALLVGATALALAPAIAPDLPGSVFSSGAAYAKSDNGKGGGNGNSGGGNGNAGGGNKGNSGNKGNGGNGNGNRGGQSASKGGGNFGLGIFNSGKNKGQTKSTKSANKGVNGFLNSVFGTDAKSGKRRNTTQAKSNAGSHRLPKAERVSLASVSVTPLASPAGKPKNFNAKLGRLNSLNRNYHAYMNSNSPHLAAIQEYIRSTLASEGLSEDLKLLEDTLIAARDEFSGLLADIEPHDDFSYEDLTAEDLEARLAALDALDTTEFTEAELEALDAERQALADALETDTFGTYKDAETAFNEGEESLNELAGDISDEALTEALMSMANENRVREYGDEYVDDDMLDWAKQVLGVGDYYGKIDEIREATETAEDADGLAPADTADAGGDGEDDGSEDLEDALRLTSTVN